MTTIGLSSSAMNRPPRSQRIVLDQVDQLAGQVGGGHTRPDQDGSNGHIWQAVRPRGALRPNRPSWGRFSFTVNSMQARREGSVGQADAMRADELLTQVYGFAPRT